MTPLVEELRGSIDERRTVIAAAQEDTPLRPSARVGRASAGAVGLCSRIARTTLSVPMIKAAGLATGTSRAVRRLRRGA